MANAQQGLQLGMQGAQIGGQLGGGWGAVAGGVGGLLLGLTGKDRQKTMAKQYNDQVVKFAAQDLFDLRREQNFENMRTAQALASYQDQSKVGRASLTASAGASDILGSSADALAQTLDFQTKEAMAQTVMNWDIGIGNYNIQIDQMSNQRLASLQRYKESQPMDLGKLVSSGISMYKQYGGDLKGGSMMDAFSSIWGTPKAIEKSDPSWKGTLDTLNADVK